MNTDWRGRLRDDISNIFADNGLQLCTVRPLDPERENNGSSEVTLKEQREYALSYFQLHANQRMTTFNFFVVIAALLTTGISGTFSKDFQNHFFGDHTRIRALLMHLHFGSLINVFAT